MTESLPQRACSRYMSYQRRPCEGWRERDANERWTEACVRGRLQAVAPPELGVGGSIGGHKVKRGQRAIWAEGASKRGIFQASGFQTLLGDSDLRSQTPFTGGEQSRLLPRKPGGPLCHVVLFSCPRHPTFKPNCP